MGTTLTAVRKCVLCKNCVPAFHLTSGALLTVGAWVSV